MSSDIVNTATKLGSKCQVLGDKLGDNLVHGSKIPKC